jgi:hypothetical protein
MSCPAKVNKIDENKKTMMIENALNCPYCDECLVTLDE